MRKPITFAALAATTIFILSCVSTPQTVSSPSEPAAPKKTTRTITVRVPLEKKATVQFADGSIDSYTVSERDGSGNLLVQTRFTASGTVVEKTEYKYESGRLVAKTIKDTDQKIVSVRSYRYDKAGLLAEEQVADADGKRLSSFEYTYDGKNRQVSRLFKDAKAIPIGATSYIYENDKAVKAELQDGSGKKTGYSVYEYDGDKLVKQSFFDAAGSLLRVEASTWENQKVVLEERKTAGGSVQQKTSYEYGPDGEVTKKTVEDLLGKSKVVTVYEYTFKTEQKTVSN